MVGAFKASGAGWPTRLDNALREWLKTPPVQQA
ncbi:MAG: BrnA antitoxin family protein [Burkholderiaceae bacterium]|nr:BrnA antitoxin family protein [Burkholderiaceae bacterium]